LLFEALFFGLKDQGLMKESELLSFALTCLKQSGLVYWRVPNGPVMHSIGNKVIRKCSPIKGFPDLAGVFPNGKFFAIELKTDKGRLSPEQHEWITKLNMSGAMAIVLRTKDEIREFIVAASQIKTPT
jgi:hypothetical protein